MRMLKGCAAAILVSAITPLVASAQTPPAPGTTESTKSRWEVEGYGGLSLGRFSRGGETSLPAPGAPITTSSPVFPGWSVPSWFFGDGAAYLNNVAAEFGAQARITPLDAVLRPLGLNDAGHVLAGLRIRAPIRAPYSLEFGLEISAQSVGLSDELLDALRGTADSFKTTFGEVLASGPFTSPVITTTTTAAAGTSRDLVLTAAITGPGASFGSFTSYGVVGGGVVIAAGDAVTAGLIGRYRFLIAGAPPVDETDTLTVRYRDKTAFVGLLGGGIERAMSGRMGIRIDVRLLVGRQTTAVEVDAAPSFVAGTPAGFIESFTYPNLQFSNNASTGRRSTLGPPSLGAVSVFEGGWMMRGRVTIGLCVRF